MLKNILLTTILLLMTLSAASEHANPTNIKPFIKGSFAKIQEENKEQAYIVMFWGQDCAYCMKQFTLFGEVLKSYDRVKLITVATDPFLDEKLIREKLASYHLATAKAWVFAQAYPEVLYFDVNKKWRGELPFSYFYNGHQDPVQKRGLVSAEYLQKWLKTTVEYSHTVSTE